MLREHYGTVGKHYCVLRIVIEHYGALLDVTEALRIIMEALQMITERYGTEPLRKISLLPILNSILNSDHL